MRSTGIVIAFAFADTDFDGGFNFIVVLGTDRECFLK
jgi:hypothetical protein